MNDFVAIEYTPLEVLKVVAQDVWMADGPAIRFGPGFLKVPFPTRMQSSSRSVVSVLI